jgi:putative Holliday junction resolvase
MSIILGIDYGDRRIGLALSDPEEKLARRFMTLENKGVNESITEILRIIVAENINKAVVGLPVGFSGESDQTRLVREFVELLRSRTGTPIEIMNEALTSKIAEDNLRAAGVKDIKAVLDQEAARIILQDYLDYHAKDNDKK